MLPLLPVTLTLAALTSASPATRRQTIKPHYPPTSLSTGFFLVANVTDPTTDLTPPIHTWVLSTAHVGAGENLAVLSANTSSTSGPIFYQNGTTAGLAYHQGTIVTDAGSPPAPYSLSLQNATQFANLTYPDQHAAFIDVGGLGTDAVLTSFPDPYTVLANGLGAGTFVACNDTEAYYGGAYFVTLEYAYATYEDADGSHDYQKNVPEGCVAVNLLPQCAQLGDLPEGSLASHEFAANVSCYKWVAGIEWSEYGP